MSNDPEDAFKSSMDTINNAIMALRQQVDSNMLLAALLGHASALAEALIAAGLRPKDEVVGVFAAACSDAIHPTNPIKTPIVHVMDGKDKGRLQ